MTVVTKTTFPVESANSLRMRRPVDASLLDSASSAFTSLDPAIRPSGDPAELNLPELDAVLDHNSKIYWLYMRPEGRPSFTFGLVRDVKAALDHLGRLFADGFEGEVPARYTVMASRMPGIFNL